MTQRRSAHDGIAPTSDRATVAFLQWALPRIGLRWGGYRKVRGTVRKRLVRRLRALGLPNLSAYRAHLDAHPDEWGIFETMCRIPISRFYRDRAVFERLLHEVLPALASAAAREKRSSVRIWSAGCASGEEPYTIAILWHLAMEPARPALDLLATDVSEEMIARAERGIYRESSLRELPMRLRERAFVREPSGQMRVREELRRGIVFRREDLRASMPEGPFDLILCRNLAFTYFDEPTQLRIAKDLVARLRSGAALVVGSHEALPADLPEVVRRAPSIYERRPLGAP
ncbi:CheR family methyltransferase [Vulgatibacter incomptus]|uniref:Chemotaxis protein methyltransferase CheR n=1 Tax=Vulgatibacter incomptus TaxID=1391653 RepID=A0A0K1PGR1_9BACT|nr:CheR family methyltransferase [Vulgatibacter incomptus]AKU92708.1 Chemotaxis protein methyltransferase CheR [Vulgatibacter incomptus]